MNAQRPFVDTYIIERIQVSAILRTRICDFEYPNSSLRRFFSGKINRNLDAESVMALEASGIIYGYQLAATPLKEDQCNEYLITGIPVKNGFVFAEKLAPILDAINQERIPVKFLQQVRAELLELSLDEIMAVDISHQGTGIAPT